MIFDPEIVTRLVAGDASALTEIVAFDDGTSKTLAECNRFDVMVMNAWMKYKSDEMTIRLAELDADSEPETSLDWLAGNIWEGH